VNSTRNLLSEQPRLVDALPLLAREIEELLAKANEPKLAAQVAKLRMIERCSCEDDFCASFYTQPKPNGSYGSGHRNVVLEPDNGMLILDVVTGRIMQVEVLYRDEIRRVVRAIFP
jgi:hypothetical protein